MKLPSPGSTGSGNRNPLGFWVNRVHNQQAALTRTRLDVDLALFVLFDRLPVRDQVEIAALTYAKLLLRDARFYNDDPTTAQHTD
jgi:hypothetical protein